jgi:integrase/recombinase XerD
MYNFSSKLWINKSSVSAAGETTIYLQVVIDGKHKEFNLKLRWLIEKTGSLQSKLSSKV